MLLTDRIMLTFKQIAADIKGLTNSVGSLAGLTTTKKTDLVSAINEVKASVPAAGATINDASTTSTTQAWSASKTAAAVSQVKADILGGAGAAYDTLLEIQQMIVGDEATAAALATAVNNRVRFDAAQTLTPAQILQACQNIGIGDPDTDFLTAYNTAKA
jgi:hypothetical protein